MTEGQSKRRSRESQSGVHVNARTQARRHTGPTLRFEEGGKVAVCGVAQPNVNVELRTAETANS